MDPCTAARPRVINNLLLKLCIDDQLPKGEAGRLARIDGVEFDEVQQIRLEFLNILKIDHLWVLKSLTILSLNNNYIEKIENLESLVNLEQLDLSFNKISKIENLDQLVKLEKLSFYENFIESIENMETLENLRIFSIGKNNIQDLQNILYFRRFNKLTSLNMANNPCTEDPNIRFYVAVFLPKISYYEYKKIQPEEIETGNELFKEELFHLEQEEFKLRQLLEEKEKQESDARKNASSFVEYLNTRHLFDQMYENDVEGKAFLLLGEEVDEFYVEYEEQFLQSCQNLFEIGQRHYVIRQAEVDDFMSSVETALKTSQEESIKIKNLFIQTRETFFDEIEEEKSFMEPSSDNFDPTYSPDHFVDVLEEFAMKFDEVYHSTWKDLMNLELTLFEQMEEVITTFDHTLGELINNFLEESQGVFSYIRSLEVSYTENLSAVCNKILTLLNLEENINMPDEAKEFFLDKDVLTNALTATHDSHMQAIDNREDTLTSRARNWFETLITDLTNNEIKRDRNIVLEISHFLEIRREEFSSTMADYLPKGEESSDSESQQ